MILLLSIVAATMETASATIGNKGTATNAPTSSLPSVHAKMYMIKITSPTKGQRIPVHSSLSVTGISTANLTSANCEVSVIVNGIKPYQKAVPTGHGGANDYSIWNYRIAPTVIKQGQNKITAKFSCGNNSILTSHNSVNVTGVANINPTIIAPGLQRASSPNNISKPLLISLDLAKNPVSAGGKETLKTTVFDASNSNLTIAGVCVNGTVTDFTNTITTKFNGTTDNAGIFTYTWKVNKDSKPGVFTLGVHASANGYRNQLTPIRTTFNVIPEAVHKTIPESKTVNCRLFILSTGPCS